MLNLRRNLSDRIRASCDPVDILGRQIKPHARDLYPVYDTAELIGKCAQLKTWRQQKINLRLIILRSFSQLEATSFVRPKNYIRLETACAKEETVRFR